MGDARVVPLILDVPARAARGAAGRLAARRSSRWGGSCPNKRIDDVVRAFALYRGHRAPGRDPDAGRQRRRLRGLPARRWRTWSRGSASAACASPAGSRDAERDRVYARGRRLPVHVRARGLLRPAGRGARARRARGRPRARPPCPRRSAGRASLVDEPDLLPLAAEALHEVVASRGDPRRASPPPRRGGTPSCGREAIVPGLRDRAVAAAGGLMSAPVAGGAGGAALRAGGERRRRAARAPDRAAAGGRPRPDRPHDLRPRLPHLGRPLPARRAGGRGGAGACASRWRASATSPPSTRSAPGPTPRPEDAALGAALDGRPGPGRPRAGRPPARRGRRLRRGRLRHLPLPHAPPTPSGSWRDRALLVPTLHDEPPARLAIFRGVFDAARALIFSTEEERELGARALRRGRRPRPRRRLGPRPAARRPTRRGMAGLGVARPYALCVGRIDLSKGVGDLVEHHARYRRAVPDGLDLVLVGGGDARAARPTRGCTGWATSTTQVKHDALAGAVGRGRARRPTRACRWCSSRPGATGGRRWPTPRRRCWWASRAARAAGSGTATATSTPRCSTCWPTARPLAHAIGRQGRRWVAADVQLGARPRPSGSRRSRSPRARPRRRRRRDGGRPQHLRARAAALPARRASRSPGCSTPRAAGWASRRSRSASACWSPCSTRSAP